MANEYHYVEFKNKYASNSITVGNVNLAECLNFYDVGVEKKTACLFRPFNMAEQNDVGSGDGQIAKIYNAVEVLQTCIVYGTHNMSSTGHNSVQKSNGNENWIVASVHANPGDCLGIQYFDAGNYVKNISYGRLVKKGEIVYFGSTHANMSTGAANKNNVKLFGYAPTAGNILSIKSDQFNLATTGIANAVPTPSHPVASNADGNPDPSIFLDFTPTSKFSNDSAAPAPNALYTITQSVNEGMRIVAANDRDIVLFIHHSFRVGAAAVDCGSIRNHSGTKNPNVYMSPDQVLGFNSTNGSWWGKYSSVHIPSRGESIGLMMSYAGAATSGAQNISTSITAIELT